MKSTLQILKDARELLSDEKRWIKAVYEVDRDGVRCFCLMGALGKSSGDPERDNYYAWLSSAEEAVRDCIAVERGGLRSIARFNDDPATTHRDVLSVLDCAIAAQEGA